jgi:hypothetical protein
MYIFETAMYVGSIALGKVIIYGGLVGARRGADGKKVSSRARRRVEARRLRPDSPRFAGKKKSGCNWKPGTLSQVSLSVTSRAGAEIVFLARGGGGGAVGRRSLARGRTASARFSWCYARRKRWSTELGRASGRKCAAVWFERLGPWGLGGGGVLGEGGS